MPLKVFRITSRITSIIITSTTALSNYSLSELILRTPLSHNRERPSSKNQ